MRSETEAALAAVDLALGLMARRVGAEEVTLKGGRDLATGTDVAAEDAIRAELRRRYPDYPVVGEERGGESEVSPDRPYWLVDPICGTRNFASGLPLFSANVALVEDGRVTIGVIGDGAAGDRYVAERGRGAYLLARGSAPGQLADDARLRASGASVTVSLDPGAVQGQGNWAHAAEFARLLMLSNRWYVRMLGTALAQAHLAAGRLSGYALFRTSSPVHTAAGCLLAEEAGALVTDLDGNRWDLSTRAFLFTATPELQRDLLAILAEARRA